VALGLIGITLQLSSITAFEMLALSRDYEAAAGEAERARPLSAGEATLATYEGTAFQVNYLVGGTLVPLALSALMLRSRLFGKAVALVGIIGAVTGLGLYLPVVGLLLSVLSGVASSSGLYCSASRSRACGIIS
jgi:hypothetical protein